MVLVLCPASLFPDGNSDGAHDDDGGGGFDELPAEVRLALVLLWTDISPMDRALRPPSVEDDDDDDDDEEDETEDSSSSASAFSPSLFFLRDALRLLVLAVVSVVSAGGFFAVVAACFFLFLYGPRFSLGWTGLELRVTTAACACLSPLPRDAVDRPALAAAHAAAPSAAALPLPRFTTLAAVFLEDLLAAVFALRVVLVLVVLVAVLVFLPPSRLVFLLGRFPEAGAATNRSGCFRSRFFPRVFMVGGGALAVRCGRCYSYAWGGREVEYLFTLFQISCDGSDGSWCDEIDVMQ